MNEENLVIPYLFNHTVLQFAGKIALQIKKGHQWQRFSYQDLEIASQNVATFLLKEGYKKGDCASIILENRPEWVEIYLGIMYAGLTCVPLDPQASPQDLKNFILDSAAKIIFCSWDIFTKKISQELKRGSIKIVILDSHDSPAGDWINFSQLQIETVAVRKAYLAQPSLNSQDIASLIYTSGTTGKPKGVLLSHKNICSNFMAISKLKLCFSTDNFLAILPFYHTYPFMVTLIVPLFEGATITFCPLGFRPQDLTRIIREAKITILVAVPQLFSLIHSAIFQKLKRVPAGLRFFIFPFIKHKIKLIFGDSLRLLVSGGARLTPDIAKGLSKLLGIKLVEGYGLTETSPVVTLNPPQRIKFGSVGKTIPDVEIKILNPDKSGIGGVLIKGPNVMQGYFRQPELTSQVIKEGWFYSGDLGYLDKQGYLFLTGREKEVMVLSSGKNIYPDELEEYYAQSPYIKEICILLRHEELFGRSHESLYAVVVANLEYFKQRDETDIRGKIRWELENLAKNIPAYKHIMGFLVIKEELPRTALKKIKRYQVRQKYLEGKLPIVEIKKVIFSEEDLQIFKPEIARRIIDYIAGALNKPVDLDSHLEIDLGIDSLSRVELGLGLEALFAINIPDEVLYRISTVRDVVTKISEIVDKTAVGVYETEETKKDWHQILSESPQEAVLGEIKIQPGIFDQLLTCIFKNLLLFVFRIFWCLEIKGRKNLPLQGPYLICCNHASYLDGFVIFSSLPINIALNTFFIGYSEIFQHFLVRWAIRIARLISIDTATHLTEAMQAISFVLGEKKSVCIFPEGQRSIDENIREFKKGVGILIKELDIPVVPVYIKGSHFSWPRLSRLPHLYPLKVIFGRLVSLKDLIKEGKKESNLDDYAVIAQALRQEVLKLTV